MSNRLQLILNYAEKHGMYIVWADDYAEPGYSLNDEKSCVFLSNWNSQRKWLWQWVHNGRSESHTLCKVWYEDNTMPRIAAILEKMGHSLEWEDEWFVCECGKAFRCLPDNYGWTMYGYIGDGDYACGDCIKDDPEDYLEECSGNPRRAVTIDDLDLEEHGYVNLCQDYEGNANSFEIGWHPGQNDDPHAIANQLEKIGITDYIFQIDNTGQFDVYFSVWVRKEVATKAFDNWGIKRPASIA